MEIGKRLTTSDRREWRAWLQKHHDSEPEIWLVYASKESGKDRKSTRLNSSHIQKSRMPSSA